MSGTLVNLIIQLISGAIGGNIAGSALKDYSLGTLGNSIASIVGVASHMCPTATRVIAGNSNGSWMMKMLGQVQDTTPPSCAIDPHIGLMPMDNLGELLCVQKRDAIERWINAGAMND